MSKAKFAAARQLIEEKKYDEARVILRTIDHPTAQEWLKRLEKLSPEKSPTQRSGKLSTILLVLVLVSVVGIGLILVVNSRQSLSLITDRDEAIPSSQPPSLTPFVTDIPPSVTPSPTDMPPSITPSPTEDRVAIAEIYWREFCTYNFGLSSTGCDDVLYPNNIDDALLCLDEALSPYVRDSHDTFDRCMFEHST